ncbi:helix-turn-helix transcriptional regulator [Salinicola socius]|uniref:helix-turn-helix transcriptional regulator n=1 Tax=Salinicola socius TaxID=404433 RepID=UPI000ACB98B4|nr:AraC family transcriptional regulator [Salinicola socius]
MISSHSTTLDSPEVLGHDALKRHAIHVSRRYRVDSVADDRLLEGRFGVDVIDEGMTLRYAAVQNRHGMRNHAEMTPGLKLILVMEGAVDVRFGGMRLPMAPAAPTALLVNLREETAFERVAEAGTRESSLTLTLSPDWLQAVPETARLLEELPHLALRQWQPGAGLLAMARSLTAAAGVGLAARLQREGLALTMAGEGLAPLLRRTDESSMETRQQRRLWEFIDTGKGDIATLTEIAKHLGMSVSTLQRLSQICYGMPLQRHLRKRRLDAANRALRNDQISVNAAAELAGYNDATNFATAFRRVFGITPRQARERKR